MLAMSHQKMSTFNIFVIHASLYNFVKNNKVRKEIKCVCGEKKVKQQKKLCHSFSHHRYFLRVHIRIINVLARNNFFCFPHIYY